ncbi:MAG: Hsp70 family protein [Armatimonadetes bacterium]|nr:Hsp70 family protein [Armatimonadota bacterium]
MAEPPPWLGIDFGNSASRMAWFNPKSGQAEILHNAEGQEHTPSVVYFGPDQVLVGAIDESMLASPEQSPRVQYGFKLRLADDAVLPVPGRRVTRVQWAAEILKKLKRDAEEGHFKNLKRDAEEGHSHRPVERAVLTHPAAFLPGFQTSLREVAELAGFHEVVLLPEPEAAALAFAQMGLVAGQCVLVYDLGSSTLDASVLAREADGHYRLAMEARGLPLGGDDLDRALYDYLDDAAQSELGRGLSPDGSEDLALLLQCRRLKENLSLRESWTFLARLASAGGPEVVFERTVERRVFEGLIEERVAQTVRLARGMVEEAGRRGLSVDKVLMVGGSSRVPRVERALEEALGLELLRWEKADVAVAIGAACHGQAVWSPAPVAAPPSQAPTSRLCPFNVDLVRAVRSLVCEDLVVAVAFHKTRETLATTSFDGMLRFWDTRSGALRRQFRVAPKREGPCLAMAPNGNQAATTRGESVDLWDLRTGERLPGLRLPEDACTAVTYSMDGQLLAVGGVEGRLGVFDMVHSRWAYAVQACAEIYGIAFAPYYEILATAGRDPALSFVDLSTGNRWQEMEESVTAHAVAFSWTQEPEVAYEGVCSWRRAPFQVLLKALDGPVNCVLEGHTDHVLAIHYSRAAPLLATGAADGTVRLWRHTPGSVVADLLKTLPCGGPVNALRFSADGTLLATANGSIVTLWEIVA